MRKVCKINKSFFWPKTAADQMFAEFQEWNSSREKFVIYASEMGLLNWIWQRLVRRSRFFVHLQKQKIFSINWMAVQRLAVNFPRGLFFISLNSTSHEHNNGHTVQFIHILYIRCRGVNRDKVTLLYCARSSNSERTLCERTNKFTMQMDCKTGGKNDNNGI